MEGLGVMTLTVVDGRVYGFSGCNSYAAELSRTSGGVRVSPVAATLRACAEEAADDVEGRFLTLLQEVSSLRVVEGALYLSGPAGTLMFERAASEVA